MAGFDDQFVPPSAGRGPDEARYLATLERKLATLQSRPPAKEPRRRSLVETPSLEPVADEDDGALDDGAYDEGASLLAHDSLERSAGTIDVIVDSPVRSREPTAEPAGVQQQAIRFKADVRIGGNGRRRADGQTRAPVPILVRNPADESTPLVSSPTSVSRRPSLSFSSRLFGTSPKAPSDIQSRSSSPAPSLYAPLAASCEAAPSPERLLAFLAAKTTGRRSSRLSTSESGYREAVSEAQAEHRRRQRRKRIRRCFASLAFWRWGRRRHADSTEAIQDGPAPPPPPKSEAQARFGPAPRRWFKLAWWGSKLRGLRGAICCGGEEDDDYV